MTKILLLLLLCSLKLSATNYYLEAAGNNANAGTSPGAGNAWQSISKLNSFQTSLAAGDSILFKRGETFFGSIIANKSGASNNKIVYGAYGTGAKPIITGLLALTFNSIGGNIWESNETLGITYLNMLTFFDTLRHMGRYPNPDAANGGYLTYQSYTWGSGTPRPVSITSSALPALTYTGAQVVWRPREFVINRDRIDSRSGTTLNFKTLDARNPQNNWGYFLQASMTTLDQQYEWYYDSTSQKAYVYSLYAPTGIVKAAIIDTLFIGRTGNNRSYLTLDNLSFNGSNSHCVSTNGIGFTVNNCDIMNAGGFGINITAQFPTVTNNNIQYCQNGAINTALGASELRAIIESNTIKYIGLWPGMGEESGGEFTAINLQGTNSRCQYNDIRYIGYIPIRFFEYNNDTIRYNYIFSHLMTKTDGAGIYSFGRPDTGYNSGRVVEGNTIIDAIGNIGGTVGNTSQQGGTAGLYGDYNVSGVKWKNNTVINAERGILLNPSMRNVEVTGNNFFNCKNLIYANMGTSANPRYVGVKILNNLFFAQTATQIPAYYASSFWSLDSLATALDSNFYFRPLGSTSIIYNNGASPTFIPLSTWVSQRSIPGFDIHSRITPITYPNLLAQSENVRIEYNTTGAPVTVSLGGVYIDQNLVSHTNNVSVPAYSSILLFKISSTIYINTRKRVRL